MTPLALLMHKKIETISPEATLQDAAVKMRDRCVGSLLIGEETQPIGIVSETDFVRKGVASGCDPSTTPVAILMNAPIITIDIGQTAKDANDLMAAKGIRHLVVTDRDQIVGILSMRDLVLCFKNRLA